VRLLPAVLTAWLIVGGCSFKSATAIRNIGVGVTIEGALVTGGALVTRDSGEGISDAVWVAAPLLALGLAAWITGEVLRGIAEPATP
jgi:hypothetical protein